MSRTETIADLDPKGFGLALLDAIKKGQWVAATHLIEADAPLIADKKEGNTALHLAAARNSPRLVLTLLARGAKPLTENSAGKTAIELAGAKGHWATVEAFASKDLSDAPKSYANALVAACLAATETRARAGAGAGAAGAEGTELDIAAGKAALALIAAKIPLEALNEAGNNALHIATAGKHHVLVNALLAAGANPHAKNSLDETPLEIAHKNQDGPLIEIFLAAPEPKKPSAPATTSETVTDPDPKGFAKILFNAVKKGDTTFAFRLIVAKAPLGVVNKDGDTVLHLALKKRRTALANQLILAEAPLETADRDANTALHLAAVLGDTALVKLLLDKGANPLPENKAAKKPIDLAAELNHWSCVQVFAQTNPSATKPYSNALLRAISLLEIKQAADQASTEAAAEAAHQSVILKTTYPSYPSYYSFQADIAENIVVKAATAATQAKDKAATVATTAEAAISAALILIKAGAPLDAINAKGNSALHMAVVGDHLELVDALLKARANPYVKNTAGEMPIELAHRLGKFKIVEAFAAHPTADPTAYSALLIKVIQQATLHMGAQEAALALIKAGTSLNSRDERGNTALHLAATAANAVLVKALVRAGADSSATNTAGLKPIQMAPAARYAEIVPIFTQETELNIAAFNGNSARVIELLPSSDLRIKNSDQDTAIVVAAKQKQWESVRAIARFASTATADKYRDPHGFGNALLKAAQANQTDIVSILLATNPPFYKDAISNSSPLHFAVEHNNLRMLTELLDAGCLDDRPNSSDKTPLELARENFPAGTRTECIAELTNAAKLEARIAARRLRYPEWRPLPSSEEMLTRLNARALELIKVEFARYSPSIQIQFVRTWQGLLTDAFPYHYTNFCVRYKQVINSTLASEFKAPETRSRHFSAVKLKPTEIPVSDILSDAQKYLVDIDAYKAKLRLFKEECASLTLAGGDKFSSIALQIAPAIQSYLAQIDSATSFLELDALATLGVRTKSDLLKISTRLTSATLPLKVPKSNTIECEFSNFHPESILELIMIFTVSVNKRLSLISSLKALVLDIKHIPGDIKPLLNSLSEARTEALNALTLKTDNSQNDAELEIMDGKIDELKKLDADLACLLSYYDGKSASNSKRDDLVCQALIAIKHGFNCFAHGISDYQIHIKSTLVQCARSAQEDHHAAAIGFGLFGKASRLAEIFSKITSTPLPGRSEVRTAAASRARSSAAGAGSDLPSKDELETKRIQKSGVAEASAAAGSGGAAASAPPADPVAVVAASAPPADPSTSSDGSLTAAAAAAAAAAPSTDAGTSSTSRTRLYPSVPVTLGTTPTRAAAVPTAAEAEEDPGLVIPAGTVETPGSTAQAKMGGV